MKLMLANAHFRVYPMHDRYFYFTVYIFATKQQMFEFRRSALPGHRSDRYSRDYQAVCVRYSEVKNSRARQPEKKYSRDIGAILFHQKQIGIETVSHEMTHAALHLFKVGETKHNPIHNKTLDEATAQTVGTLTSQFFRRIQTKE